MGLIKIIIPYPSNNYRYLYAEDIDDALNMLFNEGIVESIYKSNDGFIVFTNNVELFLKEITKRLKAISKQFCSFAPKEDCRRFEYEVNTYVNMVSQALKEKVKLERAKQKTISILKELKKTIEKSNRRDTPYKNKTRIKKCHKR